MIVYLEQLEKKAGELGLDLEEVCAAEGVAATTLQRWRLGRTTCREDTAKKLFSRMRIMETNEGKRCQASCQAGARS